MYFLRLRSPLLLLTWTGLCALWWLGGWLIVRHLFVLRPRERLLCGLAAGWLISLVLTNLLALFLPLPGALWGAALVTFAAGVVAARQAAPRPSWRGLVREGVRSWRLLLVLGLLTLLFTWINRGLAIFDDYHNLPLVSRMAAGDVPPHYYLNPDVRLAYHYGLHLFSAGMVRLAGFQPWSAFDVGKAFSVALTGVLAWVWVRRATLNRLAAWLGAAAVLLGGGTRWLLLFAPREWLRAVSAELQLLGSAAQSGPDLLTNLSRAWSIEGDGALPFPFAFVNGVFSSQSMAMGGSGALAALTLLVLLLLRHGRGEGSLVVQGLLLGSLALTAEHLFGLLGIGLAVAALAQIRRTRARRRVFLPDLVVLALAAALALGAGGVFTEIARERAAVWLAASPRAGAGFTGFALRWPPAWVSAHLGTLKLTDPAQVLVAMLEMGPALLLAPAVTLHGWRRLRRGDWWIPGMAVAALAGLTLPLLMRYVQRDRDIARLTGAALLIWLLLGFPLAWEWARRGTRARAMSLGAAWAVTIWGGIVLLSVQLTAIPEPVYSYFIEIPDEQLSRTYWDTLETDAQILDPVPYRAVTLFGRSGGQASAGLYAPLESWKALIDDPDAGRIRRAGYSYVYVDREWWRGLARPQRRALRQDCVRLLAEELRPDGDFRWLLDVRGCPGDPVRREASRQTAPSPSPELRW